MKSLNINLLNLSYCQGPLETLSKGRKKFIQIQIQNKNENKKFHIYIYTYSRRPTCIYKYDSFCRRVLRN